MSESFRLSVDIKLREKSVVALIILLLLPNTFYWAGFSYGSGDFTGAFDNVIAYLTQSTELIYAGMSYLALFAAFIVRNRPHVRSLMIVLGAVFQLMSLNQFIIRMLVDVEFKFLSALRAVFIYSENYFPFQLFSTLALVPLIYLLRQNMSWLRSEIGKFATNFKNSVRSFKAMCAYVAVILLGIFVVFSFYTNIKALIEFNGNFSPRGFYPEIALAFVAYFLDVILTTAFLGIVLVYIFNHFDLISNAVKELNSVLRDFRLSNCPFSNFH